MYWIVWMACLWAGRAGLLIWLYAAPAPGGGPLVENAWRFLPHSLVAEAGVAAALALSGLLTEMIFPHRFRRIVRVIWSVLGILYLIAAHFDAELMRWMGQHLTFSWMRNYLGFGMDASLTYRILGVDPLVFLSGFAVTLVASIGLALLARRPAARREYSLIGLVVLLVLAVTGLTARDWFAPSFMRWRRIQPVAWIFANDVLYRWRHAAPPEEYAEGLKWLAEAGNPGAGFASAKHPFWREEPGESASFAAFRARPVSAQPDVVILMLESLRGWTLDMRDSATCLEVPNLCGLARRGAFFPHAHSVGFPSVEGFTGVNLGIWSHPDGILLSDRATLHHRSLPDILGEAGYFRTALTASEPGFDNITPWLRRWYDFHEYHPDRTDDHALAARFAELYPKWPRERPLFALWMSTTTHLPFTLPVGNGPEPDDPGARYARALRYMDIAVGEVLRILDSGVRGRPVLLFVVGDHAIPNAELRRRQDTDGSPGPGQTWTALWMAGPGVAPGRIGAEPVSQLDIAPSVLSLLGLSASNHFVGRPLSESLSASGKAGERGCTDARHVLAFRLNGMMAQQGACRRVVRLDEVSFGNVFVQDLEPVAFSPDRAEGYGGDPAREPTAEDREEFRNMRRAGEAWRWVLDRDLLRP